MNRLLFRRTILPIVAEETELSLDQLVEPCRHRERVEARWIAAALAKVHARMSLVQIGRVLKQDHTTVMYGLRQLPKRMEDDPFLQDLYHRCEARVAEVRHG